MQMRIWPMPTQPVQIAMSGLLALGLWGCASRAPVQRELVIAPAPVACTGVPAATCLAVSEPDGDQWVMRFDEISGLIYEPGFTYRALVEEPPLDAEHAIVPRLVLVRVISRQPVAGPAATSGLGRGEWLLQQITPSPQGQALWRASGISAAFAPEGGWVSGFAGCSSYLAALSVDGQSLTMSVPTTTAELCGAAAQDLERTYLAALAKATTFALSGDRLELTAPDGTRLQFRGGS